MGKRGPRPKPTELRLLHGDKADRINRNAPKPPPKPPTMPKHLSSEARKVWRYYAKDLHARGLLSKFDRDAFATFCEAVVAREEAGRLLRASMLVTGYRNEIRKNPAFQLWRDSAMVMRAFAQEFGLTPSSRSSLNLEGEHGDEIEGALATESTG